MSVNGRAAVKTRDVEDGTLAQQGYLELKRRIVSLALPPGSTIRDLDLQQQLGLGRTPLRDALQRLAHDGLLRIYPRRTIMVPKLGITEVRELFEVRLALEPAAAALAARRVSAADVERVSALGETLRRAREHPDVAAFLSADQDFHRAVAKFSRNALLVDYIDRLETLNLWLWNMYFDSHAGSRADLFAHEPIVEALARRDAVAADAAMRAHITSSKEQLLAGLLGEGAANSLILGKEGHRA
jgi:DNA-binding GntR family transcriptional regulator